MRVEVGGQPVHIRARGIQCPQVDIKLIRRIRADREVATSNGIPIGSRRPVCIGELPVVVAAGVPDEVSNADRAGAIAWAQCAAAGDFYISQRAAAAECAAAAHCRGARGEAAIHEKFTRVDRGRAAETTDTAQRHRAAAIFRERSCAAHGSRVCAVCCLIKAHCRVVDDRTLEAGCRANQPASVHSRAAGVGAISTQCQRVTSILNKTARSCEDGSQREVIRAIHGQCPVIENRA